MIYQDALKMAETAIRKRQELGFLFPEDAAETVARAVEKIEAPHDILDVACEVLSSLEERPALNG